VTRICVDTSAYSHFRRGHSPIVDLIDAAREVFVPAVVLGELSVGFRRGSRAHENETRLARFLSHPVVSVLDVDDEAASHYADIWVELRAAGTPIPSGAAELELRILTRAARRFTRGRRHAYDRVDTRS